MNDKQKEVLEAELKREAKTIQELTQVYEQAAKDCSDRIRELSMRTDMENIQTIIFQKQYQEALKDQIEGVLNQLHSNEFTTISEYLAKCYEDGYVGTMYDLFGQGIPILAPMNQKMIVDAIQNETKLKKSLYQSLGEDVDKLKKSIRAELSRGIANDSTWNEIAMKMAGNFKNTPFATAYNRSITIARTEGHRVQIKSAYDAQKVAKSKGADILKQWCSTLDGHTRPHHRELDGQIREVDDYFEVGGFQVEAPSMFGDPAEDCNCRCALLQRARWALDEDELAELEERADFYGLDKSDSFEEFRQKYLKIPEEGADSGSVRSDVQKISNGSESIENIGKNGIIELEEKGLYTKAGQTNAGIFVDSKDDLYEYAKNIKPIEGFADFVCHATPDVFLIYDGEYEMQYTPKEYAELIRNSKDFNNKPIRIISCQAGAKPDGAAQQLANELGVTVLAPTETVTVDDRGRMFVSDNDILSELWENATDAIKPLYKETGKWIPFEPRKE